VTSPRKAYRAGLRAAFAALPEFADVAITKAWAMPSDAEGLPALTVLTPRENVQGDGVDMVNRSTQVVVVLKISGDEDIEDDLDDFAEVIESAALAYFAGLEPGPALWGVASIDTKIEGGARKRVGALEMRFEVVRYTAEGAQQ